MSISESLRSKRYDLSDAFAANEFYQAKGWTDGLPIVPPTEERVRECLDAAGLAPGDLIGMNATHNVFANGNRPNATIGRAIRLALINLLGVIPGEIDRSTLGHPGKFTFCIAEDEENSPWAPLAQERDIPDGESAVTVLAAGAPRQVMNEWTHDPEEILETFAAEMRHNMLTYSVWPGNYFLVIPKQLRDLLVAAGWQKHDIQEYIFRSARVLRGDWAKVGKTNIVDRGGGPRQEFTAIKEPSDLLIVAAGGPAGGFGAVIPPWLGSKGRAVTKAIDIDGRNELQ